jgi:hypothetical protein
MRVRVELQDQFLRSARGVKRAGSGIHEHNIVGVKLDSNPQVMVKEVQDWLIQHVGYEQTCRHGYDRYYYEGDPEPTREEMKKPPKIGQPQRLWRKGIVRDHYGKYERYINFDEAVPDEVIMSFLLLFGKSAEQRKGKGE